jgi:hypothetical protein
VKEFSGRMNRKTRTPESSSSVSPYETQKGTPVWRIVDNAINDLVNNDDLVEATRHDYIVGYVCKKLQPILPTSSD